MNDGKDLSVETKREQDGGLYPQLKKLAEGNKYPFHMPGHKRNLPEEEGYLHKAAKIDITEIDDFDDLHAPSGVLEAEQKRAAALSGAKESFILIGGSTAGVLSAILSQTRFGDRIVLARNCHKSAYHALYLGDLTPQFVYPKGGLIDPEDVGAAMDGSGAKLVCITSPTYEGLLSDVAAIAAQVHKRGGLLLVDQAHGAHLHLLCEEKGAGDGQIAFPESAVCCGADLVTESLHKTLPAFTGTALLHVCSDRVDTLRLQRHLSMLQTSSPSYIMMASVSDCLHRMEQKSLPTKQYKENLAAFYEQNKDLRHVKVLQPERLCRQSGGLFDPGKLILYTGTALLYENKPFGGAALQNLLAKDFFLDTEMAAPSYVLAMTSVCDTKEGFDRLSSALHSIDERLTTEEQEETEEERSFLEALTAEEKLYQRIDTAGLSRGGESCSVREAMDSPCECLSPGQSEGRIAAGFVFRYPPGIPLILPGRQITREALEQIRSEIEQGMTIRGIEKGLPAVSGTP